MFDCDWEFFRCNVKTLSRLNFDFSSRINTTRSERLKVITNKD